MLRYCAQTEIITAKLPGFWLVVWSPWSLSYIGFHCLTHFHYFLATLISRWSEEKWYIWVNFLLFLSNNFGLYLLILFFQLTHFLFQTLVSIRITRKVWLKMQSDLGPGQIDQVLRALSQSTKVTLGFNPQSVHIQQSSNECINKWSNRINASLTLSLSPSQKINKWKKKESDLIGLECRISILMYITWMWYRWSMNHT